MPASAGYHPRMAAPHRASGRPTFLGVAALFVIAAAVLGACAGSITTATARPSEGASAGQSSAQAAEASPTASASALASASAAPSVSAPAATTAPPSVGAFWAAVVRGLGSGAHLTVTVTGSAPATIYYLTTSSATKVGTRLGFICVDGAAYDGQSGTYVAVPGTYECGAVALADGFRHTGQPVDAWSAGIPGDAGIRETVAAGSDGRWRWTYRATNGFVGGKVTVVLVLDPRTGRLVSGSRTDPIAKTTYTFDYRTTVPKIAAP